MDANELEQKMAQFHTFFTIEHTLNVNLEALSDNAELPTEQGLVEAMPYAFKIATQFSELDASALRPLRNLADHAKELTDFLNMQSRKIDLMMSFILQQQDSPDHRYATLAFGAGGMIVQTKEKQIQGTLLQIKLFLPQESAAVFCFGEVIQCDANAEGFASTILFNRIREEDQELLVRASLHLQTQQLRARAKQQNETLNDQ